LHGQLGDPTYAPFLALARVVSTLFGAALAGHARGFGKTVFVFQARSTVGDFR